jgi:DNA mismatch endonuclease (patch repair protein)
MPDKFDEQVRSSIMRNIRSTNTALEMKVRKFLHSEGYRYRLHGKNLPGKPDIIFASRKKAIFIHGCFWHQHQKATCPISHRPKSNLEYWTPKLLRTVERDKNNKNALKAIGWQVMILWECEIRKWIVLPVRISNFLAN